MATRLFRSPTFSAALRMQYKFVGVHHRVMLNGRPLALHTTGQLDKNVDFHLSDIGEGIREVVIKEWYVKEGDTVEQFDNLCEVQSDKASVTITSRYDGKIIKLYHNVDDIAFVGKPLISFDVLDDENRATETTDKAEQIASQSATTAVEAAPSTANATSHKQTRTDVSSNENIQTNISEFQMNNRRIVLATPAVRRIANENNVNLTSVTPSGKFGRVLKSDVLEYLNIIPSTTEQNQPVPVNNKATDKKLATALPRISPAAGDRVETLKGVRKMMLKTMTESLKIPHFVYSDEVDVTKLVELRQMLRPEAEAMDIKLTFMPFFIKAASLALTQYPILNSSLDLENESIVYKAAHNISVAMATPDGLVVPNIKNCEAKTIVEIACDMKQLHSKGQRGQLAPDDFANGTFSLSNIGIVGGTYTAPCIMSPQVSIGAIGTTKIVPRFGENDAIVKAHIINVSWSADHRVIDGVTMANFSNAWKKYLENPGLFILQ